MSVGRLRTGELLALAGGAGLFVVLFLDWFAVEARYRSEGFGVPLTGALHTTGWSTLGWALDGLLVLAITGAVWLALVTAADRPVSQPIAAGVLTAVVGGLTALVLLVRLVTQPNLGIGLPNPLVDVKPTAWLGFVFALMVPIGAWLALADERTDAPESAYTPPPPRPVPRPPGAGLEDPRG